MSDLNGDQRLRFALNSTTLFLRRFGRGWTNVDFGNCECGARLTGADDCSACGAHFIDGRPV